MGRGFIFAVNFAVVVHLSLALRAAESPDKNVLWRLILRSDVVAEGRLSGPSVKRGVKLPNRTYQLCKVVNPKIIKGSLQPTDTNSLRTLLKTEAALEFKVYIDHEPKFYNILPQTLDRLNQRDVIAFLERARDSESEPLYGDEIFFASDRLRKVVSDECMRQKRLLESWPASPFARADIFDERVKKIIERFVEPNERRRAFAELEVLGREAVPAIIRQMDDQRVINSNIELRNKAAGSFEGIRHYHVRTILNALDAILNQVTGEYFGHSWFGTEPNPSADKHALESWRVYLMKGAPRLE